MDRVEKNKTAIFFFILILLGISFGGYYLVKNSKNHQSESKEYVKQETVNNIKKDDSKEYVYYSNKDIISEDLDIIYEDINININSDDANNLMTKLNQNMALAKESIKYADDIENSNEKSHSLFSADVINYQCIETSKYLSIIVSSYSYLVSNETVDTNFNYYVFDLATGKLLTNHDILEKENISDQDIRTKIRNYISNDDGVDIDATLNRDYYLTIAKNGKIAINFIVNSNGINYNVSIEMDD